MFLSREKIEGERCMSPEGSSVKGSSHQSSTSFPKVKGGGPLFSGPGPLITGGLVNDTTPARFSHSDAIKNVRIFSISYTQRVKEYRTIIVQYISENVMKIGLKSASI